MTGYGKMQEPLFITYANNSLVENPHNFYKIIKRIDNEMRGDQDTFTRNEPDGIRMIIPEEPQMLAGPILKEIVDLIIYLGDDLGYADAILRNKKAWLKQRRFDSSPDYINHKVAFNASFGYDDFYCIDRYHDDGIEQPEGWYVSRCASHAPNMKHLVDFKLYEGYDRIKCYACEQLFFIEILKQIINGVEYDEIPEFSPFLETTLKWTTQKVVFTKNQAKTKPFKKGISKQFKWINPLNDVFTEWKKGPDEEHPYKHVFNEFLRTFIAYSLENFLTTNDRRKIKKCHRCDKFFTQNKLYTNQKYCSICSSISKMSKERRKEYQRKYRQKKKQEKLAKEREIRIEKLINKLDCTREEAKEIIKDDLMM